MGVSIFKALVSESNYIPISWNRWGFTTLDRTHSTFSSGSHMFQLIGEKVILTHLTPCPVGEHNCTVIISSLFSLPPPPRDLFLSYQSFISSNIAALLHLRFSNSSLFDINKSSYNLICKVVIIMTIYLFSHKFHYTYIPLHETLIALKPNVTRSSCFKYQTSSSY